MILFVLSIFAHSGCVPYKMEVARSALMVYVDPSDETRATATDRAISHVVEPLARDVLANRPDLYSCAREVMPNIALFAEEGRLRSALEGQERIVRLVLKIPHGDLLETDGVPEDVHGTLANLKAAVGSVHQRGEARERTRQPAVFLSRTRAVCATPRDIDEGRCPAETLWQRVLAGDLLAIPLMEHLLAIGEKNSEKDAWRVWLDVVAGHPLERARLEAAIDLGIQDPGNSAKWLAKDWAVDELIGDIDPRTWSAENIALVVRKAREVESGAIVPAISDANIAGIFGPNQGEPSEEDLERSRMQFRERFRRGLVTSFLSRLKPLGMGAAVKLVNPTLITVPALDPSFNPEQAAMDAQQWEHFPGEIFLYMEEWKSGHPGPLDDLKGKDRKKGYLTMFAYAHQRWIETDSKAPHPDLERVRTLLKSDQRAKDRNP